MATTLTPSPTDTVTLMPKKGSRARPLFDPPLVKRALLDSFVKLNPRTMMKNPVMFVVEVGAALTTILASRDIVQGAAVAGFTFQISLWLWFTALFANFAEAMAEGRGKAQADTLRKTKTETTARRLLNGKFETVPATRLRSGDLVMVEQGETIPGDGDVTEGIASVDESAITGESAPVIRESGGDRSAVTGGTKVLSDWIKVRITSNPGETFLDRMIALVEGAERQKTPNEIALNIVIAGLTLVFLLAVVTLQPLAAYSVLTSGSGAVPSVAVLISLLVCLIPTTIGRPALRHRHRRYGSRHAAQRAGHERQGRGSPPATSIPCLLDKTGTITLGNRQAVEFIPIDGISGRGTGRRGAAFQPGRRNSRRPLQSWCWPKQKYNIRGREVAEHEAHFIPFTAQTPHERRQYRRPAGPQGRYRFRGGVRV